MSFGYITKLASTVERKHVRYHNRYGIAIAADLYQSKSLDQTKKYPAIIVGAPLMVGLRNKDLQFMPINWHSRVLSF